MMQKTYGVYGLMEWDTVIPLGERNIKVLFTRGSRNNHGVTPATYTTENEIVQYAIERSAYYQTGRIKLVKAIEIHNAQFTMHNGADADTAAPAAEAASAADSDDEGSGSAPAAEADMGDDVRGNVQKFACLDDARDWLVEAYGLKVSALRTKNDCIAAAKAKGLVVEFC